MSTKCGIYKGHKFNGDPKRFEVLAEFVWKQFGRSIKYIADADGGQGMLCRVLNKKYNYLAEVVDPRGFALRGVSSRQEEYSANMASYYDLIIGLHSDEATKEVAFSAKVRPTILIPCCNFWDQEQTLGTDRLLEEIEKYYCKQKIPFEKIVFNFAGPKNVGFVTKVPV